MENIKNKVIVITGASSGLGEASARLLSAEGAKVVLGARRLDRLEALAKEIKLPEGSIVKTDVTRFVDVKKLVDHAVSLHGRVDVVLNNAGVMLTSRLELLRVEEWEQMIDVNLKGVTYGIAAALPHMMKQKSGHFINVSSVAGHKIGVGSAVYAATKFGVRALTEGLRQETKAYNIRSTIISPGAVATELADHVTDPVALERIKAAYADAIPADSFARTVAFAISQPAEVDINEILFRPTVQVF